MSKGLIIGNLSSIYEIEDVENGNIVKGILRGNVRKNDVGVVVGDIVEFEYQHDQTGVINDVYERKNYIKRPKIANISQIVFVLSTKMPKPDLLLLDKQLAFAEFNNIKPVICINKIDLEDDEKINEIADIYENIGYKVIKTNAKEGIGLKEIRECLKDNITAFSGNSGVGKSTLTNKIFEKCVTTEGKISIRNQRGKNTTTFIHLYKIDDNSYIADTPGFSTFDIYEIESKNLSKYFIEIDKAECNCEYAGCSHIKEENCGVKRAIENGKIDIRRYESYCKIYNELKEKESHKW